MELDRKEIDDHLSLIGSKRECFTRPALVYGTGLRALSWELLKRPAGGDLSPSLLADATKLGEKSSALTNCHPSPPISTANG